MIDRIQWLGHGSFRIDGPPVIYINPWRLVRPAYQADAILITDDQYAHCSPADVDKLRGPDTVVIASAPAAEQIGGDILVLRAWQSVNVGAARITSVPAYTYSSYNPVSKGGLGFVVSIDLYDVYYAGTTDIVPELGHIQSDVAILPVGMNEGAIAPDQAAAFVRQMRPQWVIPSHWDTGGSQLDVQLFARQVGDESHVVFLEEVR